VVPSSIRNKFHAQEDNVYLQSELRSPKLTLLHLADTASLATNRGDPDEEGYSSEDARISCATLVELFSGLPLIVGQRWKCFGPGVGSKYSAEVAGCSYGGSNGNGFWYKSWERLRYFEDARRNGSGVEWGSEVEEEEEIDSQKIKTNLAVPHR
jgi:hypothetical protein